MNEAKEVIIDLDKPAGQPIPRTIMTTRWHHFAAIKIPIVGALGLMIFAAFAGGIGATIALSNRPEHAQTPRVSVHAFPGAASEAINLHDGHVRLESQLVIVNAGSTPINVRNMRVGGASFNLPGLVQGSSIEPGEASMIDVAGALECPSGYPSRIDSNASVTGVMMDVSRKSSWSSNFNAELWTTKLIAMCLLND